MSRALDEQIKQAKSLSDKIDYLKGLYEEARANIQKYFDEKNIKRYEVESTEAPIVVNKRERIVIEYNAAKLKEKLSKEIYNEIIHKECLVSDNNLDALVTLLREHGVSPKKFKELITVNEVVDKEKIKQLYEIGDITNKDLKGCYTAKVTKYIQFEK